MKSKRLSLTFLILFLLSFCGNLVLIVVLYRENDRSAVKSGTYCTDVDVTSTKVPNQLYLVLVNDGTYYLFNSADEVISGGSYKNGDYGVVLHDKDSEATRYVVPMDNKKVYLINPDGSDLVLTYHDAAPLIPDSNSSPLTATP